MRRVTTIVIALVFITAPTWAGSTPDQQDANTEPTAEPVANWPSFRGPNARGVADGSALPEQWNLETKQNVRWKTAIPGLAHSSPVIWGDMLFVTTAEKDGEAELKVGLYGSIQPVDDDDVHRMKVYCLDRKTGEIKWSKTAHEGVPVDKRHPKGSHAASTPATDGTHVVAFFGSEGLYCYDTAEGELKWKRDLGVLDAGFYVSPDAEWGFASSPVIHEDMVLVQCDTQGQSFLAALRLEDGTDIWRTPRDEVPTWSSPTIDVRAGRSQVIVNGYQHIGGYDLRTGEELWKLVGGGDIPVPTPIIAHDLLFITNAHGKMAPIYAINPMASGTISTEATEQIPWMHPRRGNYMQTPLVYGDHLVCCTDNGILSCYDARTGKEIYRERLGGGGMGFTASIVAGDDKIYATSEDGEIYVAKAGPEFEILAVNQMDETCMASPAIVDGTIYFRTRGHVVAIGK